MDNDNGDIGLGINSGRLGSVDAFRTLVMLAMVFANELGHAGIGNVPGWMHHAGKADSLTFVDLISPAFLFIVGMSIPLAIGRRRERGKSHFVIWRHILIRTVSLMVIGILMGNMRSGGQLHALGPMSANLWYVLLMLGVILAWLSSPKSGGVKRIIFLLCRFCGAGLLIYLAAIFREGDDLHWLRCHWYILGSIGWAYLLSCLVYYLFCKQIGAVVGCLLMCILFYIGVKEGAFEKFHYFNVVSEAVFPQYYKIGDMLGTGAAASLAGVVLGMLLCKDSPLQNHRGRIIWILVFAAGLYFAGFCLRPLYGASLYAGEHVRTPTWSLYSSAIDCVIFAGLYLVIDVWGGQKWFKFFISAGTTVLLVYLLSFMVHPLLEILHIDFINGYLNSSLSGILRTVVYTFGLTWFSMFLAKRCGVVLRL